MIHNKIKEEIKEAMRTKEKVRLEVLRGILTAFTNELVSKGKTPQDIIEDESALVVIKKLAKQRKDSVEQFEKAGRAELADNERAELVYLEEYLPETVDKETIKKVAEKKIAELKIENKSKMGILIGAIMKELGSNADGADVKDVVSELFA